MPSYNSIMGAVFTLKVRGLEPKDETLATS
jgi:hypothetical protein